MHRHTAQIAGQIIGQMGGLQVIGLDIAKSVFQLHSVDVSTTSRLVVIWVDPLSLQTFVRSSSTDLSRTWPP